MISAGHVAFHEGAGPVCEALLDAGVVGSFRRPDSLRFDWGLPDEAMRIYGAVSRLKHILQRKLARSPLC